MTDYKGIKILDLDKLAGPDAQGTIKVGANADYESAVEKTLEEIDSSTVGKAVIRSVKKKIGFAEGMIIVPYENDLKKKENEDWTPKNAEAKAFDKEGAHEKGSGKGDVHTKKSKGQQIQKLGLGSSTVVGFTPSTWEANNGTCHAPGARPDEILIHEMVHGLRQLSGLMNHVKVGHKYDNREEFFSILIANIYTSEKYPARKLRASHHGFKELHLPGTHPTTHDQHGSGQHQHGHGSANLSESFLKLHENRGMVERLVHQQGAFCRLIAGSRASFNPIRAFLAGKHAQHAHPSHH